TILLKINRKFQIYADARFAVEQVGFLGDQFVAIYPGANAARVLQDDDEVTCDEPFNIQEAARAALGFIKRVDETVKILNEMITKLRETVVNDQTLTNITAAARNVRLLSERSLTVVDGIGRLVDSNAPPVDIAVSNIVHFSEQLNRIAGEFGEVLMTNRADISIAVKDVKESSRMVKEIVVEAQAGKGLVGSLLKDEHLKEETAALLNRVAALGANLEIASSNLNRNGLWWMLWKHPPAPTNPGALPPRPPFRK
ncbi:MAG TPA: hypothetical protein VGK40_01680, partial [Verrucomicrobiae bacterium]